MENKIENFDSFLEGMGIGDLTSIPGRNPGERNYISDVTKRAKERMGIEGEREGDYGAISRAVGPLMQELGRSSSLSRGHEKELEKLATDVITDLYKPLIDHYNIKLDIKFSDGRGIRNMIDDAFAKQKSSVDPKPSQTPIVRARGVDFSMLIHEAVKGIWRVLSMGSVPVDKEIAKAIESQFDLRDEPEDWRYGPEIAADLRDFVNKNPKIDKFKNIREELWMYMISETTLPTEKFLDLMKGILSKTTEARAKVDSLIDDVIEKLEKRDKYLKDIEEYNRKMVEYEKEMEEYDRKMGEYKKGKNQVFVNRKVEEPKTIDYSKMTQRELNNVLSQALDDRDMEKVKEISKHLK